MMLHINIQTMDEIMNCKISKLDLLLVNLSKNSTLPIVHVPTNDDEDGGPVANIKINCNIDDIWVSYIVWIDEFRIFRLEQEVIFITYGNKTLVCFIDKSDGDALYKAYTTNESWDLHIINDLYETTKIIYQWEPIYNFLDNPPSYYLKKCNIKSAKK